MTSLEAYALVDGESLVKHLDDVGRVERVTKSYLEVQWLDADGQPKGSVQSVDFSAVERA